MEKQKLILIVDDDETVRNLLKEALEEQQFKVILAADGRTALDLAEKNIPDLVITDLLLQKEHGIRVLHTIKEKYFIPIVVISGIYHRHEIMKIIEDHNIDGFFEKPLNIVELVKKIKSILNA